MLKSLLGLAAALMLAGAAAAQTPTDPNRLFADSKLVVRDRFSDEIVGKGPDVVFVPGLNSSRLTWKATAERLRGRYRLHLIQVAGFAGEPARANAAGEVLIPTAEALDAYLAEQKLTPATLVGHSLGGTVGLYLALAHPDHFRKVLIVDAWPAFAQTLTRGQPMSPEQVKAMAEQMRAGMQAPRGDPAVARPFLTRQFSGYTADPARVQTIVDWSLATDRMVGGQAGYDDLMLDLNPKLAANRVPITIVYPDYAPAKMPPGATDQMYQTLYAAMPAKTLRRVDNALHFAMWDNPTGFAEVLDAFLAQP